VSEGPSERPSAEELLTRPHAILTRRHFRELGYERRAIDAIFRACPVVSLPGYSISGVQVADYLRLIEQYTYRGDRVRPTRGSVRLPGAPDQGAGRRPR
jgi:hypothetical protein